MAVCPALAMALLTTMGLQGILAANHQATLINTAVHHDLSVAMRLSGSAAKLREINSDLYRLATLQASNAADLNITNEFGSLAARTTALADYLDAQARDIDMNAERDAILRVTSDLLVYRDAIEGFGSMLEIDFPSAVVFFRPFEKNAAAVLQQIDEIAAGVVKDASRRAAVSADLANGIRAAVVVVSVAAALLLFATAALLTRATVRSVKQIASATERVALGNVAVDIDALARGDELGTIVRSLAVFQANVSQIAFLAHHDPLTRLPNRVLFHDRMEQALAQVDRGVRFAVLCLDLDRFKLVNDTLGHPVGDMLLRQVADRLKACVREGDTVARLGGDEFAVVLLDLSDPAEVDALGARMIEAVGSGFNIDGHRINVGTSIGMALSPADGSIADELLKKADTALYGAKTSGRGTACFYEEEMNAALQLRRETEVGLCHAIEAQEFELHYQPLVDAHSRRLTSFEALVRWQHPERGLVLPDAFVPVAESSGLIGAIGQWVLRKACMDAATWPRDISVAVNLSPSQFKDKNLVSYVRTALADSGLPADRLELEITESVLLHDNSVIVAILNEIKLLGVKISMDDFGTGYSSLSYLRCFPFDKVKIDRSFIKDLPRDRNSMAIVRAIVGLGETFGMTITAEGVETDEQAAQLSMANCTRLQGYLFSKPIAAADIPALMQRLAAASAEFAAAGDYECASGIT